jgi:hypothetical protein
VPDGDEDEDDGLSAVSSICLPTRFDRRLVTFLRSCSSSWFIVCERLYVCKEHKRCNAHSMLPGSARSPAMTYPPNRLHARDTYGAADACMHVLVKVNYCCINNRPVYFKIIFLCRICVSYFCLIATLLLLLLVRLPLLSLHIRSLASDDLSTLLPPHRLRPNEHRVHEPTGIVIDAGGGHDKVDRYGIQKRLVQIQDTRQEESLFPSNE